MARAGMGRNRPRRDKSSRRPTFDSTVTGKPQRPPGSLRTLGLALGLGLLTLAAYSNSFTTDLVADSAVIVKQDPRLREVTRENIQNILSRPYWWPSAESDLYRPVTTLSYLFNYAVLNNREDTTGYHVINFLLHWINSCLVVAIVRRLGGRLDWAILTGALFALHPVNTEAVTNIIGRADLLATLSVLLGGWCYLRANESTRERKVLWLVGLGINALWGMFAKESAVMICAFLPLYDFLWRWPALSERSESKGLRSVVWQLGAGYLALVPALAAVWIVRSRLALGSPVFAQVFVDNPIIGANGWLQAQMTAVKVLGRYFAILVYPATLSSDYSYNQIPLYGLPGESWQNALALISLGAIAGLLVVSFRVRRRLPLFTWGVWFFFLMMLPTSNLVVTIGTIMAERFLYLPAIGFFTVASMGLLWLAERSVAVMRGSAAAWRAAAAGVCVLLLAALGARTYSRNADWQDERTLWKSALAAAPNSFKAYKGSATAIWANGHGTGEPEVDAAIALAERGLTILDSPPLPIARQDNLLFLDLGVYYRFKGEFLTRRGMPAEAHRYFQKSVAVLLRAREVDRWVNDASRHELVKRGQAAGEIPDVGNFNIYVQLGAAYLDLNDWTSCEEAGRQAMRLQPLNIDGYRLVAIARLNAGKAHDAAMVYVQIVTLQPGNTSAWNELAFCLQRLGVEPVPIVYAGGSPTLDDRQPMARTLINEAAVALVRHLRDVKQVEAARTYQQDFVNRLRVPEELFRK